MKTTTTTTTTTTLPGIITAFAIYCKHRNIEDWKLEGAATGYAYRHGMGYDNNTEWLQYDKDAVRYLNDAANLLIQAGEKFDFDHACSLAQFTEFHALLHQHMDEVINIINGGK